MLIPLHYLCENFKVQPKGILHIGAHGAEELSDYRHQGIEKIVWIEANPKLISNLESITAPFPQQSVHSLLVSDRDNEQVILKITNHTMSTSLLSLGSHQKSYPDTVVCEEISLKTTRLDSFFFRNEQVVRDVDFLALDIQGAELLALKGLGVRINQFRWVYLEVNVGQVYKGNGLLHQIDYYLATRGFTRKQIKMTNNAFWGDAFYERTSSHKISPRFESFKGLLYTIGYHLRTYFNELYTVFSKFAHNNFPAVVGFLKKIRG